MAAFHVPPEMQAAQLQSQRNVELCQKTKHGTGQLGFISSPEFGMGTDFRSNSQAAASAEQSCPSAFGCHGIGRPSGDARLSGQTVSFRGTVSRHDEEGPPLHGAQGQRSESHAPTFLGVENPTMQLVGPGAHQLVAPPGLDLEEELPIGELNLLIKFLNSMGDLPRIDVGEPSNRGERFTLWRTAIETQLKSTRRVVVDWWRWCNETAERHYKLWLKTPILTRSSMKIQEALPRRWEPIEDWFFPRILAIVPERLKDSIMQERVYGVDARVVEVLFHLMKLLQPGSMDEQDHLHKILTSPNPCRDPAAALRELRRWFAAMQRAVDIGMTLPGLEPLYRGARSIYSGVFEGDDFALRLRWTTAEQQWGFPHQLSHEGLRAINQFAEAELGALVVNGRGSANTSLPLTDTQKTRLKAEKDQERKRAAAARKVQTEQRAAPNVADSVIINGQRYSSSISTWAPECKSWKETGSCSRGISCWFQHAGFPTHDKDGKPVLRCVVCGQKDHISKTCTAPGGQADPGKEKAWEQYRERRDQKGKGGKDSGGKGKSNKGKARAKSKADSTALAAIASSANAESCDGEFPAGAVGLDSWANVWLKHVDSSDKTRKWVEPLRLADGSSASCRTQAGPKGIPQALVEKRIRQENIDLAPMSWLGFGFALALLRCVGFALAWFWLCFGLFLASLLRIGFALAWFWLCFGLCLASLLRFGFALA